MPRKEALSKGLDFYIPKKPCKKCGLRNRRVDSGNCISCMSLTRKTYYENNKDSIKIKNAEYQSEHLHEHRSWNKKSKIKNKENVKAGSRRYYLENKETIDAKQKEYSSKGLNPHCKTIRKLAKGEKEKLPAKPDYCECCGEIGVKLVMDHCYETLKFRGYICGPCNRTLGHSKNSPSRLRSVAYYQEKFINKLTTQEESDTI